MLLTIPAPGSGKKGYSTVSAMKISGISEDIWSLKRSFGLHLWLVPARLWRSHIATERIPSRNSKFTFLRCDALLFF